MSSRVEFSSRIVGSSFSTRLECSSSTSQFDSTLFQKNFNSTRHFSNRVFDSNSSTRLDAISLIFMFSLHDFSSWLFFMFSLHDFLVSNDLHVFSLWLSIMTLLHDFSSWLFFMIFYQMIFMFFVMILYQKDNVKR